MLGEHELYGYYDDAMSGKTATVPSRIFSYGNLNNRKMAEMVFRYAFEVYLGWTPEMIVKNLDIDVLARMKLDRLVQYLCVPGDLEPHRIDPRWYASVLYPQKVSYSDEELVIYAYKRVLERKDPGYPKSFFVEESGAVRARVCLSYVLQNYMKFPSLESVYATFSSSEGGHIIKDYRLNTAASLFETPVDYVHESLVSTQRDEFFRMYYKFCYLYRNTKLEKKS